MGRVPQDKASPAKGENESPKTMAAQGLVAFKRLYWGNIHGWGLSSETSQDAVLHLAGQLQSPGAPAQKYLTWGGG